MALRPSHAISPLCTDSHKTYGVLGLGRLQTRRHELGSGPNLRCLSIRRQCLSGRTTFNFRWRKRSISGDSNLRIKQQPTQWILILRHLSLLLLGKIVLFFLVLFLLYVYYEDRNMIFCFFKRLYFILLNNFRGSQNTFEMGIKEDKKDKKGGKNFYKKNIQADIHFLIQKCTRLPIVLKNMKDIISNKNTTLRF